MVLTLLNVALMLQPGGVSWLIWALALLVLLAGVSMLVYFVSRFRRGEKETEEDWSLSRRSLFVNTPVAAKEEKEAEPVIAATGEAIVAPQPEEPDPEALTPPPVREPETRLLSSDQTDSIPVRTGETIPLDDNVWAELKTASEEPAQPTEPEMVEQLPPQEKGTSTLGSIPSVVEPPQSARISPPTARAPFEPPRIERVIECKPFDPPRIEPILPGERLAKPRATSQLSPHTGLLANLGHDERGAEPEARDRIEKGPVEAPPLGPADVEPAVVSSQAARPRERKIAGTILNLPPEASSTPLVFGDTQRSKEDLGIGSLTNYGKDTGPRAGHGGTIALALAILLVAGSTLAYLYIPSVNSRVNDLVARIRSSGQAAPPQQPAVERPRARILPSLKPEVNKNMVKIRGAVYNTSDQPIEGLSVEITLQREGDAPAETRSVAVNPSTLAPGQQGVYEIEYDGKTFKSAGITNLTDKDGPVKYTIPLQK